MFKKVYKERVLFYPDLVLNYFKKVLHKQIHQIHKAQPSATNSADLFFHDYISF
jgi:hypothetical protein